jgi:predicted ATPase
MKILNRLNNSFQNKQEIELNFNDSRLHALVGQNGSGKTYVLKTIAFENSGSYHKLNSVGLLKIFEKRPYCHAQAWIQNDGSYLCIVLNYLCEYAPDKFKFLQNCLVQIIPNIEGVFLQHFEKHTEIRLKTKNIVCVRQISDGCLLILGILTTLLNPQQSKLILIDNIEQNLHASTQRELINVIKEIIAANSELQVIFSTHSPYVVDKLALSQVHVLRSAASGLISCKRLDEHPDAEWAKQTLTTGEFWDSVGEDW